MKNVHDYTEARAYDLQTASCVVYRTVLYCRLSENKHPLGGSYCIVYCLGNWVVSFVTSRFCLIISK